MTISANIAVGNNVALGYDSLLVSTSCMGFVTLYIQQPSGVLEIELDRRQLHEFMIRTQPNFTVNLAVDARTNQKPI
jgi:hypothetical protein